MENIDPGALVTMVTVFVAGFSIAIGTIAPALAEGRAAAAALESMARQPELAGDIRTTLLISMALLESTAIYVLLVVLILIFANPLIGQFF